MEEEEEEEEMMSIGTELFKHDMDPMEADLVDLLVDPVVMAVVGRKDSLWRV